MRWGNSQCSSETVKNCIDSQLYVKNDCNFKNSFAYIFKAYYAGNDFDLARKDFEKACELEPDNKAAKNQVKICEQKIKQFDKKEKAKYQGMFEKFAAEDSKKV